MSYTRVFNDFKRRLLNGEVDPSFDCSAYLMNSSYAQIYDNLQYMRSISDFEQMNYGALHSDKNYGLAGSALAAGCIIQNDYYRESGYDEETDFISDPIYVTSANSATYVSRAAGTNPHRILVMQDYIDTYGGFFLVSKIDEFSKMCSIIEENECERYAVVLADDIENVIVNNALLNRTRQHPFRGVFDGNGFALQIQNMFVNDRTCGVFGYIADEGVVRNLIIQPAKIEGVSSINVYSTSQISLDTIKLGQGDVRFGVLAGVNEGMCENVVVSADLSFYGKWRPNIYFTHNKYVDDSVDEVSLYSPEWQSAPSLNVSDVTAISSYSNLCFPTQLCINSEANLIPYVGYFGEAAFAHAVEQADKLEKPLYAYPMSGTLDDGNTTFCHDIELLYSGYCDDYNKSAGHNSNTYSKIHTQRDIMQRGTFRLGPNNRAAYLIGGVFGLNNGCINNVNYSGTMDFNNCTVALIGGIAGRQARGTSHDSIGNLCISTTSGAFADTVTIDLPEKTYLTQYDATTPLSAVVLDDVYGSITIYNDEGNTTTADCHISPVDQYDKRFLPTYQYKSSYIGELSASANDNGQSDYSFYACKVLSVSAIPTTDDDRLPEEIAVNSTAFADGSVKLRPYSFSLSNAYLQIDSLDSRPQLAKLVTHDTNTYKHVDDKTAEDVVLVQNTSRIFVNLSGNINSTSSVYCTITADLSATRLNSYDVFAIDDDDNTVTKTGEYGYVNIKLPPLFHVGGYCGEYVLTDRYLRSDKFESESDTSAYYYNDMQLTCDMSTCGGFAYLSNRATIGEAEADISSRQYGDYNTIAGFAACISVDTMNKSDCDTISSYAYTSATKLHYKYFVNTNFSAGQALNSKLNTVFSEPSKFAKYFYYTPDMMPSVVMAASHGRSHHESKTYEPNFGITWLDQLFYGTGQIEPGSESNDSLCNYAYWMKNNEWTDKYVNTISQAGYSDNVNNAIEQNDVYANKSNLLKTFFKFNDDANELNLTMYSPKQHVPNTINAPFQYPAGRAGYSKDKYENELTRSKSYSFSATDEYYTKIADVANFDIKLKPDSILQKTITIEEVKPIDNSQSYIFTYSSTKISDSIQPVNLNLSYASAYSLNDMSTSVESADISTFLQKEQTNKCYILSSDSFSSISANKIPSNFNFVADDNEPLTSNRLVYGFVPTTADIVKCLDVDPLAHLYCSGISANDLQYVLIVDDKYRPIFDIKLDIESVNNQGYSVEFDKAGYHTSNVNSLSYTYSGGMAINIKTGN